MAVPEQDEVDVICVERPDRPFRRRGSDTKVAVRQPDPGAASGDHLPAPVRRHEPRTVVVARDRLERRNRLEQRRHVDRSEIAEVQDQIDLRRTEALAQLARQRRSETGQVSVGDDADPHRIIVPDAGAIRLGDVSATRDSTPPPPLPPDHQSRGRTRRRHGAGGGRVRRSVLHRQAGLPEDVPADRRVDGADGGDPCADRGRAAGCLVVAATEDDVSDDQVAVRVVGDPGLKSG